MRRQIHFIGRRTAIRPEPFSVLPQHFQVVVSAPIQGAIFFFFFGAG
jgi:hypothetical protein